MYDIFMKRGSKAVSTVVATVLIILITVAAVTFLWVSVNSFFGGKLNFEEICSSSDISISASGY
ncbi:MAG: archaellin/type IV pilin N-terminal domain-containing protein, partial [Nanoarchaeota archaeon]